MKKFMKVYKIEDKHDTIYFCFGGDKDDALKWYLEEAMQDESDIVTFNLFPRKQWKEVKIKFEEFGIKNFSVTIEEFMEGMNWNQIICSTEFL